MRTGKLLTLVFAALVISALNCAAYSTYTQQITGSTSSMTINQSQHGFTDHHIVVLQYDSSGNVVDPNNYYTTWDLYNDITIYFNNPPSSGKIEMIGQFDSLTTAGSDFEVSVGTDGSGNPEVVMCSSCSHSSPAVRCIPSDCSGISALGIEPVTLSKLQGTHTFTLRVYLQNNMVYFGYDYTYANWPGIGWLQCHTNAGWGCQVVYTTGYPTGSVPLGHTYFDGSVFETPVDDRSF